MNVIDGLVETTVIKSARILFHKLLKAVFVQLFIFHMKILMLFHIGFVLEGELARGSVAVEVCCLLVSVHAVLRPAILRAAEPEESLPLNGVVLAMVVEVHLHIGGADVDLENNFGLQKIFLSDKKYF